MAESGLDSLTKTREVAIEWKAYELRPGGKFPGTPEQEARYRAMVRERHGQMTAYAREHFGLEMGEPPLGVNSRPALEGERYAREHGKGAEYHHACFVAHWREERRLDDMDMLTSIARSLGLNGDEFREAVTSGKYHEEVEADLQLAYEYGINGVPAFIFGNRYLVSGARPAEFLEQVVDKCVEEGLVE
ncbi:MAG: DsbA family protein [Chloroflexi bacterium]|nr:DsbA family protein [Chloroflexota bacterium]